MFTSGRQVDDFRSKIALLNSAYKDSLQTYQELISDTEAKLKATEDILSRSLEVNRKLHKENKDLQMRIESEQAGSKALRSEIKDSQKELLSKTRLLEEIEKKHRKELARKEKELNRNNKGLLAGLEDEGEAQAELNKKLNEKDNEIERLTKQVKKLSEIDKVIKDPKKIGESFFL